MVVAGHGSMSSGSAAHHRLAASAIGMAAVVAVTIAVSYALFGVAYAVGGADAVEDTWVGYLAGLALVGGLLVSLIAFALALVAKIEHERRTLLWLPLSVFPALVAVVTLAEVLWLE